MDTTSHILLSELYGGRAEGEQRESGGGGGGGGGGECDKNRRVGGQGWGREGSLLLANDPIKCVHVCVLSVQLIAVLVMKTADVSSLPPVPSSSSPLPARLALKTAHWMASSVGGLPTRCVVYVCVV